MKKNTETRLNREQRKNLQSRLYQGDNWRDRERMEKRVPVPDRVMHARRQITNLQKIVSAFETQKKHTIDRHFQLRSVAREGTNTIILFGTPAEALAAVEAYEKKWKGK